jgi:two-component system, LuxR family, sensor kinase FixL
LNLDIQSGLPSALGDRVHLSQVILNLLMNGVQAVQSRPAGARRVAIEACRGHNESQIEITVRDTGHGVPEDIAEKIFMPFFTTKPEGTGMGLALSRVIVEAHGGHLWAEPGSSGEGAIFRFTLRAVSSQEKAVMILG